MKILMVLTSHDRLGNTGKKTGFWLEEFAAPFYVFKNAGAEMTLAVNAKHVVHSGDSGNNGGYHTNPLPLEGPPNEVPS